MDSGNDFLRSLIGMLVLVVIIAVFVVLFAYIAGGAHLP